MPPKQPCKFFQKGACRFGNNCKFSHEVAGALNDALAGKSETTTSFLNRTPDSLATEIRTDLQEFERIQLVPALSAYGLGLAPVNSIIEGRDMSADELRLQYLEAVATNSVAQYDTEIELRKKDMAYCVSEVRSNASLAARYQQLGISHRDTIKPFIKKSLAESMNDLKNQPASMSGSNPFGGGANPFGSTSSSAFGNTQGGFGSGGASSAFGNTQNTSAGFGSTGFGNAANSLGFSSLGFGSSNAPQSGFGNSGIGSKPAASTGAFGSQGFGSLSMGAFGSQGAGGAFGQLAASNPTSQGSSGFGLSGFGLQSTAPATQNATGFGLSGFGLSGFGQAGFGSGASSGSAFGLTGFGSKPQTSGAFGSSGFGQSATAATPFGSNSANPPSSGFGGAQTQSPFGSLNNTQSAFGTNAPSAFGSTGNSQLAFGGLSGFGQSNAPLGGANSSASPFGSSGFGQTASANDFQNKSVTSAPTSGGFGSQPAGNAFGNSNGQTALVSSGLEEYDPEVENAFKASAFQLGKVPEVAPPAIYC